MSSTSAKAACEKRAKPATAEKSGAHKQPRLTYLIGILDRLLRRQTSDALAPLGITLAQYMALSVLEAHGPQSNAQLAVGSFITPQSANEVMTAMASRGFVTREADPSHGSIILLQLTEEGEAMLRECEQMLNPVERQMLGDLNVTDVALARRSIEFFVRNLRN